MYIKFAKDKIEVISFLKLFQSDGDVLDFDSLQLVEDPDVVQEKCQIYCEAFAKDMKRRGIACDILYACPMLRGDKVSSCNHCVLLFPNKKNPNEDIVVDLVMQEIINQKGSFVGNRDDLFDTIKSFSKNVHDGNINFDLQNLSFSNFISATTAKLEKYLNREIELDKENLNLEIANTISKLYSYEAVPMSKKEICFYKVVPFKRCKSSNSQCRIL